MSIVTFIQRAEKDKTVQQQLTLSGVRLQDNATFDNFYSDANQQLCDFLQTLFASNELYVYIWGNPGAGCSHLLQACCHKAHELNKTAMYLPLSEYHHLTPEILDGLEEMDLVVLDDIQVVMQQSEWEEAIFHLFNRLRSNQRQLLIGANNPPNEIGVKLPDLLSRLNWGVIFRVNALTDEDKVLALQLRAKHRGIKMPEEVAGFLLRHYSRSTNDLFEALDKLDTASLAEQRKLTVPFVKQVLQI